MRSDLVARAAVVLCLVAVTAAQQPPLPRFRSGIDIIQLDVTVLDKDRRPVRDLTAADFTVLEDGKPRPLVAFTEVTVPEPVASAASWVRDVAPDVRTNDIKPEGRLIVIVMDDATLPPDPSFVESAKTIARQIVDSLGPADLAAVVFTLKNERSQDFTDDRARLRAAIDAFSYGFAFNSIDPGDKRADLGLYHQYSIGVLAKATESLRAIAHARKTIFYVSIGAYVDPVAASTPPVIGGQGVTVAEHDAQVSLYRQLQDTFDQALKSNVNIYAIDPGGLDGLQNFFQVRRFSNIDPRQPQLYDARVYREYLRTVSNNSGGYAVVETNRPEEKVPDIFRENSDYYLLGFQSEQPPSDGKFHGIQVRVNRPGVTVMSRNGYFAPRPAATTKRAPDKTPSPLVTAMAGFLPAGDIPMRVTTAPFAVPGKKEAALAITASIRQSAPSQRETQTIELLTRAFDPQGNGRASSRQTARVVLRPAGGDDAQFDVLSRIDVKPGRYSLRIAANNTTSGKSGSVYIDVDVPDFAKAPLGMSGVVLATDHPRQAAPRDALATIVPIVPTSLRDFSRDDQVTAFARIYQGGKRPPAPVAVDARVRDSTNRRVYGTATTLNATDFDATRAADFRVTIPCANFPAGSYMLSIDVSASGHTTVHHVRFEVH